MSLVLSFLSADELQDEQAISTLGPLWDRKADHLRFKVKIPLFTAIHAKRKVMYIDQIFDPLGLLGPVIAKAKILMQRLWTETIPHYGGNSILLHFFADVAYGACYFFRTVSADGIQVRLLTSMSKVATLSTHHSIARLGLCAVHLATQLLKKVEASLKINSIACFCLNSSTVLQ